MKHLYFIFSFLLAVGMIGCKDDDEPGTNKKKFDVNATIKIRGEQKSNLRNTEIGTMSYEDSIKFIVKYAWMWKYDSHGGLIGTAENGSEIGALEARDTTNNKFIWSGLRVVEIKDITPEKDTIYQLGPFITHLTDYILLMAMKEDGTPRTPDPRLAEEIGEKYEFIYPDDPADTVGYIPNSVVLKARELITEAFNRGDYDRCYQLFDSAYVFIPITGEKYRELKARGEN